MPRHSSKRPIVEWLPYIAIKDLVEVIPRRNPNEVYCLDSFGLRYGGAKLRVSTHALEVASTNGNKQVFRIKWVRTGMGKHRPLIVCSCGRSYQQLYYSDREGRWACRRCLRAHYLCQRISKARNKLWQAARLRIELNGAPSDHKIPPRPRGQHRKTYLQLYDQIAQLEAKARRARKREFDIKLFAYHLT
jgi:hypothetical protein